MRARSLTAVLGWVALITAAVLIGAHLHQFGELGVAAPPFQAHYRFLLSAAAPGLLVALIGVSVLPPLCRWLPWRLLLPLSVGSASLWAVSLAVWDGHAGVSTSINRPPEYLPVVPLVGDDPGKFLRTFTQIVRDSGYPVHVKGHPPLMVLVFWVWDHLAPGPGWAATLVIVAGASSAAVSEVFDESEG